MHAKHVYYIKGNVLLKTSNESKCGYREKCTFCIFNRKVDVFSVSVR